MSFNFYMPVKLITGKDCILRNSELFNLGKRCIIVTGRYSAKVCGALDDVTAVLEKAGTEYIIYDQIDENPLLSVCWEGGRRAAEFGAEYVIGIGGGSPLDASKAIAAFAANDTIEPAELFNISELKPSLALIGIPTTSGTGSEVNPYSVLTLDGETKKRTFNSSSSYFKYAFVDPDYTRSLNREYTISTALDAFCHCIESYLSPKSTGVSRLFAEYGAKHIWRVLNCEDTMPGEETDTGGYTYSQREALSYAAAAGGVAINTTGTGFPHPMGYNLTLERGIPHGKACAAFTGEYIKYNRIEPEGLRLTSEFARSIGADIDEIIEIIPKIANVDIKLDANTILAYVAKVKDASNYNNSPYKISELEMQEIYTKLFYK